jgi:iron complex outermembrane receptor protein
LGRSEGVASFLPWRPSGRFAVFVGPRVGGCIEAAGVNNLFDKVYRDHTNGINRVSDSDVMVGDRLPGPGRSLFARVNYRW